MSVNKVILLGHLGADPEMRYTPSNNIAICNLRLATNDRRKGADGQWTDVTEWHRVVCFGKTAENCNNYLKKGRQVFIEGRIQTRKWQDQEGKDRYSTEIIANTVQFVGSKAGAQIEVERSSGRSAGEESSGGEFPVETMQPVSFDDDDIPF